MICNLATKKLLDRALIGVCVVIRYNTVRLGISCVLLSLKVKKMRMLSAANLHGLVNLALKTPRKPASENVVCLCRLLNIHANFSNLFLHTGKQCGPRSDCS